MTISDFFEKEYATKYVKYTYEERAIPSLIDGLKPSYRKSLYSALTFMKKGKTVSGLEIVGETYKKSAYHHGNSSIEDVIINQGASYKDNTAPFIISGSGGDLRNQNASAIRYLKFMLSDFSSLYNVDLDILEHNYDGENKIEPTFFLPIVPLVLTAKSKGAAVGFAFSNGIQYSLESITEASLVALENLGRKKQVELTQLTPFVDGYDNGYEYVGEDKWKTTSKYTIKGNKVIIEGLPVAETFDSFEKNLSTLIDKEKIVNFVNETSDKCIKYIVTFNRTNLQKLIKNSNEPLEKLLRLTSISHKNVYVFLDENKDIIESLNTPNKVIEYFVRYRLSRYNDRKKLMIKNITEQIDIKTDISRFIKAVVDGKLELRNRPIKEIKAYLTKENIKHHVLDVKVTKITKEEYLKLLKEIDSMENEREKIRKTKIESMYKTDLKELLTHLKTKKK
ncbi:DNA topoisomerase II [Tenacibaculum phage pT24]|uniref:DNA topoisomerase (ATP-hydrolyzing) n=1 Tax=Tenacibaculum phage pT24 TaxID=1880590 RepID=A0A1W7GKQ8_9CAUD|nr:DNA topoisomerase II [Tenacibaculum phage pT24]BAX25565.1 DNA topoisomerase II [Tenacibaculum phage pT24]